MRLKGYIAPRPKPRITSKGRRQATGLSGTTPYTPPDTTAMNTQRLQSFVNSQGGAGGTPPAGQGVNGTGQLPWDAQEQTQEGLLNRNLQNQRAQYGQQENDTRSQYGFDAQYASNPLTKANLLQRSYEQGRLGATNNMAARGQGYSGATSNALGYQDFNHAQNYNALQTEYQGLLNQIAQGRISAQQSHDEGVAGAQADALSRALATDPEAIAPDVPGSGNGTGGTRKDLRKNAKGGKTKGGITAKGQRQKSGLNNGRSQSLGGKTVNVTKKGRK